MLKRREMLLNSQGIIPYTHTLCIILDDMSCIRIVCASSSCASTMYFPFGFEKSISHHDDASLYPFTSCLLWPEIIVALKEGPTNWHLLLMATIGRRTKQCSCLFPGFSFYSSTAFKGLVDNLILRDNLYGQSSTTLTNFLSRQSGVLCIHSQIQVHAWRFK